MRIARQAACVLSTGVLLGAGWMLLVGPALDQGNELAARYPVRGRTDSFFQRVNPPAATANRQPATPQPRPATPPRATDVDNPTFATK